MTTLVLGHGKLYETISIRCSPISLSDWRDQPYISVDREPLVEPDIVYDLDQFPWSFALDQSYDRVIDTTGLGLKIHYRKPYFETELKRILKPGGIFYGRNDYLFHYKRED